MKKRRAAQQHGMQGAFVFVLLGVFALMSTLLVLFGAQMYKGTVNHSEMNNESRVLSSYVRSMIRAEDARDAVAIEEYDGVETIALHETIGDIKYVTWLYAYEDSLYEQFTMVDRPFSPINGTKILPVKEFSPKLENGVLTVDMVDESGKDVTVITTLRCGSQGPQQTARMEKET